MGTLQRSWALLERSLAVVTEDPELLVFPLLSAFILVVLDLPFLPQFVRLFLVRPNASVYGTLLVLYCANDFVIIFFNSALMAAVAMHLDGQEGTVAGGLRAASRWIMEIMAWSLIAGTVGLAIQVLEQRLGKNWRFVGKALGLAWSATTFFIIPVIIFEGRSDVQALRRSADLFRRQWGTEVVGRLGLSAAFFLAFIPVAVLSLLCGAVFAPAVAIVIAGMSVLLLYLVHEAAEGVFVVALYRYATNGTISGTFTPDEMQGAFARKDAGWTDVDLSGLGSTARRLGTPQDLQSRLGADGGTPGAPPAGSGPR
jgi:Family of unknown function (DUF6159)